MKNAQQTFRLFLEQDADPFFEHEDRPKTTKALRLFFEKVPDKWWAKMPWSWIVLAISPKTRGSCLPFFSPATLQDVTTTMVYLSPDLERLPQSKVNATVAHEFAHAILGHAATESMTRPSSVRKIADHPNEVAADRLIVKWGYKPAYSRPKGWR